MSRRTGGSKPRVASLSQLRAIWTDERLPEARKLGGKKGGKGKGKAKAQTRAREVADPRVYLDRKRLAIGEESKNGEDDWGCNAQYWEDQQPAVEPEAGSTTGDQWLYALRDRLSASNRHLRTPTLGVDSGAEVAVICPDTASDFPRERGAKQAMCDCTRRPLEDMGRTLGYTFAKSMVAPVQQILSSVAALVNTGHEVTFKSRLRRPRESRNDRHQVAWRCLPRWDQGPKAM